MTLTPLIPLIPLIHLEDDDLQLTYMQQRYYDPLIGRFYSNDPVGFKASNLMMFNRYAYANNNPYKFIDPDGEEVESIFIQGKTYENYGQALSNGWGDLKQSLDRDVQTGVQKANDGVTSGGQFAKNNLGNASTLMGVLPGGQLHAIALGLADAVVNSDTSSTSSATVSALTGTMLTDIATDSGRKVISGKVNAIIYGTSLMTGYLAGEADKQNVEKQTEKTEEKKR
jgi:RHS repeat-associated protein